MFCSCPPAVTALESEVKIDLNSRLSSQSMHFVFLSKDMMVHEFSAVASSKHSELGRRSEAPRWTARLPRQSPPRTLLRCRRRRPLHRRPLPRSSHYCCDRPNMSKRWADGLLFGHPSAHFKHPRSQAVDLSVPCSDRQSAFHRHPCGRRCRADVMLRISLSHTACRLRDLWSV